LFVCLFNCFVSLRCLIVLLVLLVHGVATDFQ
jgi:hypothetical protein